MASLARSAPLERSTVSRDAVDAIRALAPEDGVALWWLGQSGFVIRGRSATIVIDPFLTDYGGFGRLYDPPFPPGELDFVDLLVGTHLHADHIDPLGFPQVLDASPAALAIVPSAVLDEVGELVGSRDRLVGAISDARMERAGVTISPLPAVHASVPADGYGFHLNERGEHPFLGYVFELDGVRIGHLGDTLMYDGLPERLSEADLDVLIVPINGVSWFREQRGLVGNLNVFEAAELAASSGARLALPVHWDLFADNTEDPEHFVRYVAERHPDVNVTVPRRGTPLRLAPRGG